MTQTDDALKPCPNPWCKSERPPRIIWDLFRRHVRCDCGVIGPGSAVYHSDSPDWRERDHEAIAAWNRRADLATQPVGAVKVKPLVWKDFDGRGAKASAFYSANYLINLWNGRGQFEVSLSYPGHQTGYDGERWHDTLEAAKAAAQADYEARILSALEHTQPDPLDDPRVVALIEAWRGVGSHPGISLNIRGDDAQHTWDAFRAALAAFDTTTKSSGNKCLHPFCGEICGADTDTGGKHE